MIAGRDRAARAIGPGGEGRLYSVSPYGNLTGAPISAVNHARLMQAHFGVVTLVLSQPGDLQGLAVRAGVPELLLPIENRGLRSRALGRSWFRDLGAVLGSRWKYFRGLCRELRRAPGVVHVHSSVSIAPLALGAAWWCRLPAVLHIRESARSATGRLWMRVLASLATGVVCVSDGVRQGYGAGIRRRARVIHNFMELPPVTVPQVHGIPRFFMAAKLSRAKGVDVFLEVCRRLRDAGVRFEAWIVGDWVRESERAEAQRYILEQKLEGAVVLKGLVEDMPALYAQMDVLLLPTRRDSFPRVVMEAMGYALPVVVSRVDGTPEMVVEGETGFLVELEDVEGFAATLQRLLQHEALRRQMGAAARVRAQALFSPEAYAAAMLALYREIGAGP
jgi:glycosyltransferase involved in cell wall biosynthesis